MCLLTTNLPGYIELANQAEQVKTYLEKRSPKPMRRSRSATGRKLPRVHNSLMKAWYGKAATADNDYCFDWLPKFEGFDVMATFETMHRRGRRFHRSGFNPLAAVPNSRKVSAALAKLKSWWSLIHWRQKRQNSGNLPVISIRWSRADPNRGVPFTLRLFAEERGFLQLGSGHAMALEGGRPDWRIAFRWRHHGQLFVRLRQL